MHQNPYQFNGLGIISTIFYILDIAIFIIIASITLLRLFLYPKVAHSKASGSMEEIGFYGAAPIAFLTIAALTGLIPSQAGWGGHSFTILAYVLYWIGAAWMLMTCVVICISLFKTDSSLDDNRLSAAIFLPAVGVETAAVVGGLLSNYSRDFSPRLAVPAIIVGYMLTGIGIWLSMILYSFWFRRLTHLGWPEPAKLPSIVLLVGPMGQAGSALMLLGTAANSAGDFAGYSQGVFLTGSAGSAVSAASTVLALLFLGFDVFWLIIAVYCLLEGAYKGQLSYSLSWWSVIFPVATLTTSFILLSTALDSVTFRVLATAFLILLVIAYICNLAFTIVRSFTGDILVKPPQEEQEKKD